MSTIEYYYPLDTLTTNSVSNKFFFKNDSSTIPTTTTTPIPIPKTRINFAMSNGIKGTAKEYYIKTINNIVGYKTKMFCQ